MGTGQTPLPQIPALLLGMGAQGFYLLSASNTAEPPESSALTKKAIFWPKSWASFADALVSRLDGVMVPYLCSDKESPWGLVRLRKKKVSLPSSFSISLPNSELPPLALSVHPSVCPSGSDRHKTLEMGRSRGHLKFPLAMVKLKAVGRGCSARKSRHLW